MTYGRFPAAAAATAAAIVVAAAVAWKLAHAGKSAPFNYEVRASNVAENRYLAMKTWSADVTAANDYKWKCQGCAVKPN